MEKYADTKFKCGTVDCALPRDDTLIFSKNAVLLELTDHLKDMRVNSKWTIPFIHHGRSAYIGRELRAFKEILKTDIPADECPDCRKAVNATFNDLQAFAIKLKSVDPKNTENIQTVWVLSPPADDTQRS